MRWSTPHLTPIWVKRPNAAKPAAVQRVLRSLTMRPLTAQDVIRAAAAEVGCTPELIVSRARVQYVTRARHIAMTICRLELHMTLPRIGRRFERDHTTVLHACRRYRELVATCMERRDARRPEARAAGADRRLSDVHTQS
jgi:chromosomal replication initiation ATPase DnaA